MLACFEIYLLYPQHFQSIIFFVYCVVSFCSTSTARVCVARLWKTRTKKIPKTCFAVLEDVVFMLSYVSRWGKNRSGLNRPPTHPWAMLLLENQFYFDENFMKSLPTQERASHFPFCCVERRRIFSFSTPNTVLFTHPRDIPSLPPFFRTTSVLYVQLT